mgnify:CR=1 FL=1
MSTIKSSAENLTLNADGANNDVIIQSNGSTKVHIDGTGKVGIGTTTPQTEMHVVTANTSLVHIGGAPNANGNYQGISLGYSEVGNTLYRKVAVVSAGINDSSARQTFHVLVDTASDSGSTQLVDSKFSVSGTTGICQARNGLTFGSDTAAANALDDYEEGTWTPVFSGSSTAGSYSYAVQVGYYTKIGRLVTVTCSLFNINDDSGAGAGNIKILGLPFTVSSAPHRAMIGALELDQFAFAGSLSATAMAGETFVELRDSITGAGDDVLQVADRNNDTSDMCFQVTYTV